MATDDHVALGEKIINEVQMELFSAKDEVGRPVSLFLQHGQTGRADAG